MQDTLIEMGRSPLARNVLRRMGIKPPPQLIRSYRPWSDDLLLNKHILLRLDQDEDCEGVRAYLTEQGATLSVSSSPAVLAPLPGQLKGALNSSRIYQGSVFDSRGFKSLKDLKRLYDFFHGLRGQLGSNHRAVILSSDGLSPEARAISFAVQAFARSLSREFGPKGINVNVLKCGDGAAQASSLSPILAFFLSDFCAFVTGQVMTLSLPNHETPVPKLAGSLAGKRALVTGAAQGIGYAICRRLAEEGAHVLALDRPENEAALKELAKDLEGEYFLATLGEDEGALVERLSSKTPYLDILVHNAGVTRDRTLLGMSESEWDTVLSINLEAVVNMTTDILRRGMLRPGGRVVGLASVVGLSGNFGQTNYAASKAGLIGYLQGLSDHVAREGGTANAIAPGFIETNMTAKIPFVAKQFARRFSSLAQGGTVDDVADMVAFLASPCSQSINGQVLRVCGGSFLGA